MPLVQDHTVCAVWKRNHPSSFHSMIQGSQKVPFESIMSKFCLTLYREAQNGLVSFSVLLSFSKSPLHLKLKNGSCVCACNSQSSQLEILLYNLTESPTVLLLSNEVIHTIWRWCAGKWKRNTGLMGAFRGERWAWWGAKLCKSVIVRITLLSALIPIIPLRGSQR